MICSRCDTKFCWMCLQILPEKDPYSHFTISSGCWDISAAHITDELHRPEEEEEEVRKFLLAKQGSILTNFTHCPDC